MATSLRKSSSTTACQMPMTNSNCVPSQQFRRQNSEIRVVFKTLSPTALPNKFYSTIKNANDSGALDTSFEMKPLVSFPQNNVQIKQHPSCNKCKTWSEKRFLSLRKSPCECVKSLSKADENSVISSRDGSEPVKPKQSAFRIPFSDFLINSPIFRRKVLHGSSTENVKTKSKCETPLADKKSKLHYIYKDEIFDNKFPTCSTPITTKKVTHNPNTSLLNLQTPPPDARFIDSDYDSESDDKFKSDGLAKCFSLSRSSCRSLTATIASLTRTPVSAPSSPSPRRYLAGSTPFDASKQSTEVSPLKRQRNIKLSKNIDIKDYLKAKTAVIRKIDETTTPTLNDSSDNLGCRPLLTKENLEVHLSMENKDDFDPDLTLNWGDNFEFSFICEPSMSDDEEADTDATPNNSLLEIPAVKISPPHANFGEFNDSDESGDVQRSSIIRSRVQGGVTNVLLSPFRRSISDPSFLVNDNAVAPWLSDERFIKIERDIDNHVTVHQANVVSLTKLSVSFFEC